MTPDELDHHAMGVCLREAEAAAAKGEVPVGAAIFLAGSLVASAHNLRETTRDPTAHAEILVLREAATRLARWRLTECALYVCLEPCPMCAGALVNARVAEVVFGCADPKAGACGTLFDIVDDPRLNHRLRVRGGVRADECAQVLREFFRARR